MIILRSLGVLISSIFLKHPIPDEDDPFRVFDITFSWAPSYLMIKIFSRRFDKKN